jgi:hypothetical protein
MSRRFISYKIVNIFYKLNENYDENFLEIMQIELDKLGISKAAFQMIRDLIKKKLLTVQKLRVFLDNPMTSEEFLEAFDFLSTNNDKETIALYDSYLKGMNESKKMVTKTLRAEYNKKNQNYKINIGPNGLNNNKISILALELYENYISIDDLIYLVEKGIVDKVSDAEIYNILSVIVIYNNYIGIDTQQNLSSCIKNKDCLEDFDYFTLVTNTNSRRMKSKERKTIAIALESFNNLSNDGKRFIREWLDSRKNEFDSEEKKQKQYKNNVIYFTK